MNKLREDNVTLINYEPFIHNCYIPDNLGSYNVLNDVDHVNYLYSGRGNESGYDFENGGMVRIIVTNVSIKNDFDATCSYSLYVCGQNAIAAKENETPVYVFRDIQNLEKRELYYNETIVWAGTPEKDRTDVTRWFVYNVIRNIILMMTGGSIDIGTIPLPSLPSGYNIYGYNPRTYEFTFNGTYKNKEALIDAVDAGMWEWGKSHFYNKESTEYFRSGYYKDITNTYFSYSPIDIANISEDSSLNFDSGCWNVGYENTNVGYRNILNFDDDVFTKSGSLYHIFNFSSPFNINSGNRVRMVLGIKKIFITEKPFHYEITGIPRGLIDAWNLNPLNLIKIPTTFDIKYLDEVNNKYNLNLDPRVILVMDPVTFCSG
jgi:hypothetical protein